MNMSKKCLEGGIYFFINQGQLISSPKAGLEVILSKPIDQLGIYEEKIIYTSKDFCLKKSIV